MNPDVVAAIARLRTDNVLSGQQAALLNRVARRHLVSVRLEIRLLLYVGVLLLTSGVGVLVVEHQQAIGPLAIAGALSLATLACLVSVARTAPPFSWRAVESPNVAFDYILLLGLLLFASALGYVEAQFTVLGPRWPHHLLIVGVVYFLAAYRGDSRMVLGLALTTLAAWRGVSLSLTASSLGLGHGPDLRSTAIVIGLVYLAFATLSVRLERKAHFEEVFGNTGLVLLLGGLVSGAVDASAWGVWLAALLATAGVVMWISFGLGRSLYFAVGVVAAYIGLLRLLFHRPPRSIAFLVAALLGVGALTLIFAAHRRMIER
jgi:Predicted membrane protein (DUF2157)